MKLIDAFKTTAQRCKDYVDNKHVELDNAIETHGMGWTTEEPVPAINITWDGNTEGKEAYDLGVVIACKIQGEPLNKNQLVGATISFVTAAETTSIELSDNDLIYSSEDVLAISTLAVSVLNDTETLPKGLYFYSADGVYASALTKEASTKETVHQIDEKYIPSIDLTDYALKTDLDGKSDVVISSVDDITPTQVATAISQGKTVVITVVHQEFGSLSFEAWNVATDWGLVISNTTALSPFFAWATISLEGVLSTDSWEIIGSFIATSADMDDKLDISQGVEHAGEFLVVGADGNVTTRTLSAWQGGSY